MRFTQFTHVAKLTCCSTSNQRQQLKAHGIARKLWQYRNSLPAPMVSQAALQSQRHLKRTGKRSSSSPTSTPQPTPSLAVCFQHPGRVAVRGREAMSHCFWQSPSIYKRTWKSLLAMGSSQTIFHHAISCQILQCCTNLEPSRIENGPMWSNLITSISPGTSMQPDGHGSWDVMGISLHFCFKNFGPPWIPMVRHQPKS